MKTATLVLLLAIGVAVVLAGHGGDHERKDHRGHKGRDHDDDDHHDGHKNKYKHKHNRYHHSSSSSSPEHRYRHHHRRQYKRQVELTTVMPVFTSTEPLIPTGEPRQADAEFTTIAPTTAVPELKPTTLLPAEPRQADAETTIAPTTVMPELKPTTLLPAEPRQADFEATTEITPQVIGTPIQTSVSCDFSCKFFTLINSEDGMPVNFNYRTSPDCLQVDAFCDEGFTLVTYGKNEAVPLDAEGHGIINCSQQQWFDMNKNDGSNVMCVKNELVNKPVVTPAHEDFSKSAPIELTTVEAVPAPFEAEATTLSH